HKAVPELRNHFGRFVAGAEIAADGVFHQRLGHQRIVDQQTNLAVGFVDHVVRVVLLGQGEAELGRNVALVEVDQHEIDATSIELRLVGETLELRGDVLRAAVAVGHDEGRQTRLDDQAVDIADGDVIHRRANLEKAGDFSAQAIAGDGMNRFFDAALEVLDRANHQRVVVDQQEIRTVAPGGVVADVAPGLGILGLVETVELDGAGVVVAVAGDQFELLLLDQTVFLARIGDDHSLVTLLEQKLFGVAVGQFFELENGIDVLQRRALVRSGLIGVGAGGSLSAACDHGSGQNDQAHGDVFEMRHRSSFQMFDRLVRPDD
ncbi:MAG: hypothetical protein QG574_5467, partial [Cyanobacteriota bacterium erpe_2018_sw_21hr_WHONDRS-SW48-000092_B_bin.40]|nr:hypothetical protein [Cyanobacteriota bacterium erpe_2018_sw_21hr_WHONDRS-SW48-000092_B_bin.40]